MGIADGAASIDGMSGPNVDAIGRSGADFVDFVFTRRANARSHR